MGDCLKSQSKEKMGLPDYFRWIGAEMVTFAPTQGKEGEGGVRSWRIEIRDWTGEQAAQRSNAQGKVEPAYWTMAALQPHPAWEHRHTDEPPPHFRQGSEESRETGPTQREISWQADI